MGRSTSWGQLGQKITKLEDAVGDATLRGVKASSAYAKRAVMMNLGSVGAPVVMSRVGARSKRTPEGRVIPGTEKKGRHKVGVRYDIKKSQKNYTSLVRAYGSMHWLERGTQPHWIPRAKNQTRLLKAGDVAALRGASGSRSLSMKGPSGNFWKPIWHPGARPKRPWSRGIALARRQTEPVFAAELQKGMRRIF